MEDIFKYTEMPITTGCGISFDFQLLSLQEKVRPSAHSGFYILGRLYHPRHQNLYPVRTFFHICSPIVHIEFRLHYVKNNFVHEKKAVIKNKNISLFMRNRGNEKGSERERSRRGEMSISGVRERKGKD